MRVIDQCVVRVCEQEPQPSADVEDRSAGAPDRSTEILPATGSRAEPQSAHRPRIIFFTAQRLF